MDRTQPCNKVYSDLNEQERALVGLEIILSVRGACIEPFLGKVATKTKLPQAVVVDAFLCLQDVGAFVYENRGQDFIHLSDRGQEIFEEFYPSRYGSNQAEIVDE